MSIIKRIEAWLNERRKRLWTCSVCGNELEKYEYWQGKISGKNRPLCGHCEWREWQIYKQQKENLDAVRQARSDAAWAEKEAKP